MKKILLGLLALSAFSQGKAQENTRGTLVYGNLSLLATNDKPDTATHINTIIWNVSPGIGYQFGHSTVGVDFGWGQTAQMFVKPDLDPITQNRYKAGLFYRYTQNIGQTPLAVFGQLTGHYLGGYTTSADKPSFDKYDGFNIGFVPAIALYMNGGFAVNFSVGGIGYGSVTADVADPITGAVIGEQTNSGFNLDFGQTYNIGVSKNFGRTPTMTRVKKEKKMKEEETESEE